MDPSEVRYTSLPPARPPRLSAATNNNTLTRSSAEQTPEPKPRQFLPPRPGRHSSVGDNHPQNQSYTSPNHTIQGRRTSGSSDPFARNGSNRTSQASIRKTPQTTPKPSLRTVIYDPGPDMPRPQSSAAVPFPLAHDEAGTVNENLIIAEHNMVINSGSNSSKVRRANTVNNVTNNVRRSQSCRDQSKTSIFRVGAAARASFS